MSSLANDCPFQRFRDLMPVAHGFSYLDHAAVGPLPITAQQGINQWVSEATFLGDTIWPTWNQRVQALRSLSAELINASADEMAIVPNTTAGINLVSQGIRFKAGDNVVLPDGEFPSNYFPWKILEADGIELRIVPRGPLGQIDLNELQQACDQRTRLVSASWVGFASGYRLDVAAVAEIAHRHGAYFFLDAIQGLGVFPIDVKAAGVDFLAADGHKWMLGPEGAGLFYVRQSLLDELKPQFVGWNSVVSPFNFSEPELKLKPTAARYEGGSQNMVGTTGLLASLQLLAETGLSSTSSQLADQVLNNTDLLCDRLQSAGAQIYSERNREQASGIVAFSVPVGDPAAVRQHLIHRGVITSCRGGVLRAALHAYNNQTDIDRLIEGLISFKD